MPRSYTLSKTNRTLNELSSGDREYILVSSEEKYLELCKNKKLVSTLKNISWGTKKSQGDSSLVIRKNIVSDGFNDSVSRDEVYNFVSDSRFSTLLSNSKILANSALESASNTAQELKSTMKRRKEEKEFEISNRITIPCASPQEAQTHFTFGAGELNDGGLYKINPFNLNQYIPIASYYDYLAKERVAAFLRIAQTLGAKELKLMQASFTTGSIITRASIGSVGHRIGLNALTTEDNQVKEQVMASFSQPTQLPYIPDELKEQVDASANLRMMASGRTDENGNMESIQYLLSINESSSSFGKLVSKVSKCGLYVGSKHKKMQGSTWMFSIVFWPRSECGT